MAQVINTNMMSLNAQRNLTTTQSALSQSIQRLSTGLRVNSAKDDAAGLAIAERMNGQVRGMNVAIRNANDAISMSQTAEGALGKLGDMAQRMRELAVQSANATNTAADRVNLDTEYQSLKEEMTRTIGATKFNGKAMIAGDAGDMIFQVSPNADASEQITVTTTDMTSEPGNLANILGTDGSAATTEITALDTLVGTLTTERAKYGAVQNRFDAAIATLQVSSENQAAARSRIMDADFAAETASLTRSQVLQQAGTAMLSQANSIPNNVLSLLR